MPENPNWSELEIEFDEEQVATITKAAEIKGVTFEKYVQDSVIEFVNGLKGSKDAGDDVRGAQSESSE